MSNAIQTLSALLLLGTMAIANPTLVAGTWVKIQPNGNTNACTDIQFDPSNPSTLWIDLGGDGVYKSTDGGSNWVQKGALNSLGRVRVDPQNSNHLYYIGSVNGTTQSFRVTTDGGTTWTIPAAFSVGDGVTWNHDVYNMAVDPINFNHVIMTFHSSWVNYGSDAGILESKDGGTTFIPHPPISGMSLGQGIAFLHDPAQGLGDENTWLVGGGYGNALYRTTNSGNTWSTVATMQENHGGFDAHYSPATGFVYMAANNGIWRSTDNGTNWANVYNALGNHYYSVIGDGNRLYSGQAFVGTKYNLPFIASNEGGGANEGTSWSNFGTQVMPEGPFRMVFDDVNHIIYAATWSGGAWALKTGGSVNIAQPSSRNLSAKIGPASRQISIVKNRVAVNQGANGRIFNVKGMLIK